MRTALNFAFVFAEGGNLGPIQKEEQLYGQGLRNCGCGNK
jgi:hypothetical protein